MKTQLISSIMTRSLYLIDVNSSLIKAKNLMKKHGIHHLPVVLNEELVGILSENDLEKVEYLNQLVDDEEVELHIYEEFSIRDLMSADVTTLNVHTSTIEDAVSIFKNRNFQCLPVLDGKALVGIITTTDLFKQMQTNEANFMEEPKGMLAFDQFVD